MTGQQRIKIQLDERSPYLTAFACQIGRHRYKRLPFGAASAGDMFQRKVDEIFKDLPNVFGIANSIFVVGYDTDGKKPWWHTTKSTTEI